MNNANEVRLRDGLNEIDFPTLSVRRIRYDNEDMSTDTSREQENVEKKISKIFEIYRLRNELGTHFVELSKDKHIRFLKQILFNLPKSYTSLDCSRTWMCYWITHSLALLGCPLTDDEKSSIVDFISRCQCAEGGFGGSPGQKPHLAATYGAINALCTVGTLDAYRIINRDTLLQFLESTKNDDGSFSLEPKGETDIRGVYCAVAVATITNIGTPHLYKNTVEWLLRCQTYEGGFAGNPGNEAHGGYSFCGIASLALLQSAHLCNARSLLRWAVNKQMQFEGGFQGRTNKLVDACYSFWQGAIFPILINEVLNVESQLVPQRLFNTRALQEYILMCCQDRAGGLCDKCDKPRDAYHTCYALSGLSLAQHGVKNSDVDVVGLKHNNLLLDAHPLYNLETKRAVDALSYFCSIN